MASRLKRLVQRRKDDVPSPQQDLKRSSHGADLSSQPYETASIGQLPVTGTTPIRSSHERTSSQFESRRSKRFSRSSQSSSRPRLQDTGVRRSTSSHFDGLPHAENLYESDNHVGQHYHHGHEYDPRSDSAFQSHAPLHPYQQRQHHPAALSSSPPFPQSSSSSSYPNLETHRQVENSYKLPSHRSSQPRRASHDFNASLSEQEIINRAQYNSEEIGTAITTAPAVTHEVVHHEIHHIREEQITREIHDHDVYHRMLPIVDVEVLPARHFLPAEGGGLVEIGARDAPGRGKHWIVAETASKIPSNQPINLQRRDFTARAFPGTEGDDQRYYAPEGHLVTEQTWVHPPELETGARDTGQSWPLEIEKLSLGNNERPKSRGGGSSSSKSPHRRSIERKPVAKR